MEEQMNTKRLRLSREEGRAMFLKSGNDYNNIRTMYMRAVVYCVLVLRAALLLAERRWTTVPSEHAPCFY